jgi:hypothetical protein
VCGIPQRSLVRGSWNKQNLSSNLLDPSIHARQTYISFSTRAAFDITGAEAFHYAVGLSYTTRSFNNYVEVQSEIDDARHSESLTKRGSSSRKGRSQNRQGISVLYRRFDWSIHRNERPRSMKPRPM